jgi:predicted ATPase
MTGVLHQYRREPRIIQEHAATLLALATQHDFPYFVAHGTVLHGWACAALGQSAEGLAQIREALAMQRTMGSAIGQTHWLALLADACMTNEQSPEGLRAITEALTLKEQSGEEFYTAELYRVQGELTQQMAGAAPQVTGRLPSPEACFSQALAIARQQQARSLELRAAMSLARLWQRQGKRAAAQQLLAPIYGWFTEGFDTADLQEARALLEVLG